MAKKARTPPPPRRPVQAPRRRETRKTATVGAAAGRNTLLYAGGGALVALAIAVVLFLVLRHHGSASSKPDQVNYDALPGMQTTKAPWQPEYAHLADRLLPLGLKALSQEQLVFHIHQHLDIYVNGEKVAAPASIGINDNTYLTELHTHDSSGVIHIESEKQRDYTLGDFFGVWGLRLDARCIGGYCGALKAYVNGRRRTGDPSRIVLSSHEEIVLVSGKPPKTIPKRYAFPQGE